MTDQIQVPKKQKKVVQLIRTIMQLHGKTRIWNNLYFTKSGGTRTIKCYQTECPFGSFRSGVDISLQDTLRKVLDDLKVDYKITFTETGDTHGKSQWFGGFIVKLKAEHY